MARYISSGEFGLWHETGRMNDVVSDASRRGLGLGEALGQRPSSRRRLPHKETSVLAAGVRRWACR
ncbi:MAG: hypothetical protein U0797_27300 [Gemmataceae bacterium]